MCPQTTNPKTVPGDRDEDFHTALHEILHIIGWSSSLFPFFRDSSGYARTTRYPPPPHTHRHPPTHRPPLPAPPRPPPFPSPLPPCTHTHTHTHTHRCPTTLPADAAQGSTVAGVTVPGKQIIWWAGETPTSAYTANQYCCAKNTLGQATIAQTSSVYRFHIGNTLGH
jgi:hypothetical protein